MTPFKYADYAALPHDGRRYELIDGELVMTPSPGYAHQHVLARLFAIVNHHVRERRLGDVLFAPLDVILSDATTVQPDIVYLSTRDRERQARKRGVEGPPTLIIEALSPSRPEFDLHVKRELYFRHGVPHYWIVDPEKKTLEGLVPGDGDYVRDRACSNADEVSLRPFPDLVIPLASIWAPELPD